MGIVLGIFLSISRGEGRDVGRDVGRSVGRPGIELNRRRAVVNCILASGGKVDRILVRAGGSER